MDNFCGSSFWDWEFTWNTESPAFTPCFERTVIAIFPSAFLVIFTPVDFFCSFTSSSKNIPWSALNTTKLALTLTLFILELVSVLVYNVILPSEGYVPYPVDIYIPTLRAFTLLLCLSLLLYSKKNGVRSSGIQFLFWLLSSITQAIRFRTVILSTDSSIQVFTLELIYFPIVIGQLILHCWADLPPTFQPYYDEKEKICPESTCSFPSRILFEWFSPMIWKGYRKPLEQTHLWQLNWWHMARNVVPIFDYYWPLDLNRGLNQNKKQVTSTKGSKNKTQPGIFTPFLKAFGWSYFFGFLLKTTTDVTMFISPLILNLLIQFVTSDEPTWKGVFYAVILFINAFSGTLFTVNGVHNFYIVGMKIRTCLVSAVYRKSLLLSNSARRAESVGEIVNHMAVDAQYTADIAMYGYHLWGSPIIISVGLYFLWTLLGPSAIAGLVVMILLIPLNGFIASKIQKLQKLQMKMKDSRTKLMTEILSGMKVLKLYAWEPSFETQVMKIRKIELEIVKKTAYLNAVSNFLWTCAPFMVALSTFGTYVLSDSSHVLDAQTAFVSLAVFNLMSQPLAYFPILISSFIQAGVAIKRLNKFMNADEIDTDAVTRNETEAYPIVIENGTFAWDKDIQTLNNINLKVKDGELVAIVGIVGSGKSSLLSCLLNELIKISGRANIRGNIAYVAQQAWIQNATLRENILFGKPYDPLNYSKVIEACALKPDLEMLPAGDKTEIGEKGINLSGGQKQRIALARSVYSNADVYLFDDPLSAVDAHVGKHIFEKVLGPKGLLRKKTRVLVTHGVVYLPLMDSIFVMTDGKISESGTYKSLLNKNGAFADFLKQHLTTDDIGELSGTEIDLQAVVGDMTPIKQRKRLVSDSESEFSTEEKRKSRLNSSVTLNYAELDEKRPSWASIESSTGSTFVQTPGDRLIEVEKAETESVKASVYLDYFRAAGWGTVITTFALYFVFQGFSVGANLWLSNWTSLPIINGTQSPNEHRFYLGIYGGLGIMQAISILLATLIMAFGMVKSANVLHLNMLQRILRAPLAFFDVTPIGRIVNRFSKDVDSVDNGLPMLLRYLMNSIFSVLAVLAVITLSTPIFIAVIIPIGCLYYIIQRFYIATARQLKRLESVTRSPIYSHFGESVSGASTIRAYNQQERFVLESERRLDANQVSYYTSVCANRWLQMRLETVGNTIVFFAALFAVLARETLSPGLVGLSVSYALQITTALIMLVRFTSDVETNVVAVERMKEYSHAPQEAPWQVPGKKLDPKWPQAGKIVFDQYKTRYRPGLELVLRNVTCVINPSEKVGIVGRTGAGKSSMTLALFRIVEAAGGSINIDGEDISRLGLHDVRGRITIIPQDPVLFSGSLRINLDPFETQNDNVLYHALELAHLKTFVSTLPGGLDYEIAEGGENLSVGQRQLVCLARALLRKTKVLVLDEASSALDLDTDDLIQQTIRKEFKDATVITIAHRLNTIMDSDRVIVLDKGEIREFDSPKNLLANENSIFSGMAKEAGQAQAAATSS